MEYKKCCRNCEFVTTDKCKGCSTFGENTYENFMLRFELVENIRLKKYENKLKSEEIKNASLGTN